MTQATNLEARLGKLETTNRRWRFAALGMAGALGLTSLMSINAAMCDVVSAERFVLRDARGQTRMTMDAYHTSPNLALRNDAGKVVAQLGLDEEGEAHMTFFDARGNARGAAVPAVAPVSGSCGEKKQSCTKKEDGSVVMR
jgi:hypothetical protein